MMATYVAIYRLESGFAQPIIEGLQTKGKQKTSIRQGLSDAATKTTAVKIQEVKREKLSRKRVGESSDDVSSKKQKADITVISDDDKEVEPEVPLKRKKASSKIETHIEPITGVREETMPQASNIVEKKKKKKKSKSSQEGHGSGLSKEEHRKLKKSKSSGENATSICEDPAVEKPLAGSPVNNEDIGKTINVEEDKSKDVPSNLQTFMPHFESTNIPVLVT